MDKRLLILLALPLLAVGFFLVPSEEPVELAVLSSVTNGVPDRVKNTSRDPQPDTKSDVKVKVNVKVVKTEEVITGESEEVKEPSEKLADFILDRDTPISNDPEIQAWILGLDDEVIQDIHFRIESEIASADNHIDKTDARYEFWETAKVQMIITHEDGTKTINDDAGRVNWDSLDEDLAIGEEVKERLMQTREYVEDEIERRDL